MRVLLLKLSSMGDIIHTLPAVTDAARAVTNLQFTWVIENAFQEIAHWHPAVNEVIPIALRERNFAQIFRAFKQIRATPYDLVIDAQGLCKSAAISTLVRTKLRAGFDYHSVREAPASFMYNQKYSVSWEQHAVDRLRQLFAQIFGYEYSAESVDYGVPWENLVQTNTNTQPYLVFLHGTTWESKHWPDEYWLQLADLVAERGLNVRVTWATVEQKKRAQLLAAKCPNVLALPKLSLQAAVTLLHNACGVVAVDTGFAHLSAALGKPMVAIYGPTDVIKAGTKSNNSINIAAKFACAPCASRVCTYAGARAVNPPCFKEISPQRVWQSLAKLLPI